MNKNDIINEVVSSLVFSLNKEQLELVKSTFIVKMQGYEIHELCTLPSTEVRDNDFIFKRFTVDMLAKGLKQSSIKNYMDLIRPFFDMTGKNYRDVTSQDIIDYLAIRKIKPNASGKPCSQTYISNINRVLFIFFEWAYRKHHIDVDIMRDVDRIRPKQKRKERITREEIESVKNRRYRIVLYMHHISCMSFADIATKLDKTERNVYNVYKKAVNDLEI